MEPLEHRDLLANWLWVAGVAGNWDAQANWRNLDNAAQGVPVNGDGLTFNPNLAVSDGQGNTYQGTNTGSTNNLGSLSLASLTISSTYNPFTGLTLTNAATDTLTITSSASVANGRIRAGAGGVKIANNTTFAWTGGTLTGAWKLGDTNETNVTTTISGTAIKTLDITFLSNFGTITWTGSGSIDMLGAASIENSGTFDVRGDSSITGGAALIVNTDGTFKKTSGLGTTTIHAGFVNRDSGSFLLQSGVVKFTGTAKQRTSAAVTELHGGNLETTSTYYVGGGVLRGVGTITGNVALYDPDNPQLGGEVIPGSIGVGGVGGAPGILNIGGDFVMGVNGILGINIDANGNIGMLRVQQNAQGQGGNATLDGVLWVNRHPDYRPGLGTTRTFMEYISVTGDFFLVQIFNNLWPPGLDNGLYFAPDKLATSYRLIVRQAGGGEQ